MSFQIDPNAIVQALTVLVIAWTAKTLWSVSNRLDLLSQRIDAHERLDDQRFAYIEKKLDQVA